MLAQVRGQLGKTAKGALAQVMLDALNVGKVVAVIESHQLEEIGQHRVTFADFFRHARPLRRQRESRDKARSCRKPSLPSRFTMMEVLARLSRSASATSETQA